LFESGKPLSGTYIIVNGRIRVFFLQRNGIKEITISEAKAISGYLPFSRGLIASAMGMALTDTQVMIFPKERINELIRNHFELTQALVHVMTSRVREFTSLLQQNEKMMALGKLSAGLAHELNNPASAIVRSSVSLKKHLQLLPKTFKEVIAVRMNEEQVDAVNDRMFEVLARNEKPVLSLMERTGKEDELAVCFEKHNIDNSSELAENFVEFGFTKEDMDEFARLIPEQYLSPIFNWINNNLITEKMVNDIQEASQRISVLVNSVKNFTHMDRASDKQEADIHTGLRNTLTMLGYKLRKGNIELVEDYDTALPKVKAMIGELNQVWTNLIDNALDAMEVNKKGVLTIKTERDKEFVRVLIIDNGPGIPDEIKPSIFDPFFTTKDPGKGTGLGLDVVSRIVQQHKGSIKVKSEPGHTAFEVCFPING
jgi:signal transduction histidine kinase